MRTNRYLIAGLIVSVALNLILVGVIGGRVFSQQLGGRGVDHMVGLRQLLSELPPERAEALSPYFRDYLAAMRPNFREIRRNRRDLAAAIVRDPLDRAALEGALTAFGSHLHDTQRQAQSALVDLISALAPAERQALVGYMTRPPRGEHPGGPRPRAHRAWPPPDGPPPGPSRHRQPGQQTEQEKGSGVTGPPASEGSPSP